MNIIGVVAEFNPFHNGHKYFLNQIRNQLGQDLTIICAISSSFVQRGQGAVLSKWDRTKLALENGADLVIELPFVFSCQNAEVFAKGAIKTLSLANINGLYFGSEEDNIQSLINISKKILNLDTNIDEKLKANLKTGLSFIKARNLAYLQSQILTENEINIISKANNILALEYIKAINYYNKNISLGSVKRSVDHDSNLSLGNFASASKIRSDYFSSKEISAYVPFDPQRFKFNQVDEKIFLDLIKYLLLVKDADLSTNIEYEYGIENRLKKFLKEVNSLDELVEKVSNKRITKARVRRLLVNAAVDVNKSTIFSALEDSKYLRILGMSPRGMAYLKNSDFPYVQKFKDFEHFDPISREIYIVEQRASKLYSLLASLPYDLDYIKSPIIKKE